MEETKAQPGSGRHVFPGVSIQQLRCFCETALGGSFTAAAESLGVSQPAVAMQVRGLERYVGTDLFVRGGRGVVLTAAGHAFAEHAPAALQSIKDAVDCVQDLGALRGGTIDLGVNSAPAVYRFDKVISDLVTRHPGITLRLVGHNSSTSAELVRSGALEAAVVVLPVDDDRLKVVPFARDEVLYVSAEPERARAPVGIDELATRPLVFYDVESARGDPLRRQLTERAQRQGVSLHPRVEVDPIDLALSLVAAGIGDTYVPRAHTFASYYPSGLFSAPFAPAVFETFAIVTRRGARTSPAMRVLLDLVTRHLASTISHFNAAAI